MGPYIPTKPREADITRDLGDGLVEFIPRHVVGPHHFHWEPAAVSSTTRTLNCDCGWRITSRRGMISAIDTHWNTHRNGRDDT